MTTSRCEKPGEGDSAQEGLPTCWPPAERDSEGSTSPSAKRPWIRLLVLCSWRGRTWDLDRLCLSQNLNVLIHKVALLTLTSKGLLWGINEEYRWRTEPHLWQLIKHSLSLSPFLHCLCQSSCPVSLLFWSPKKKIFFKNHLQKKKAKIFTHQTYIPPPKYPLLSNSKCIV